MQQTGFVVTEDEVLISRFQRGEDEAFDRLMAIHTDKIFALAWGVLQNREDAMDATQEVFIKMHGALGRFSASDNLNAWLYRVCLNHCIDRKRRAKWTSAELSDADWERLRGSESDEPEFRACQNEVGRIIRSAVDKLPERQRQVVTLRDMLGFDSSEVCELLDISVANQRVLLHRGRAVVRKALEDYLAGRS